MDMTLHQQSHKLMLTGQRRELEILKGTIEAAIRTMTGRPLKTLVLDVGAINIEEN